MREYQDPIIEPAHMGGERYKHPAYATLAFSRSSCGGNGEELFGSSIRHRDYITMTLYHANMDRELNQDWIHGDKIIARCEMSLSQFAEAITSLNMGSGVPVTLNFTEKDGHIPKCHFENKRVQITNELKDKLADNAKAATAMRDELVERLSSSKPLTKGEKEDLIKQLNKFVMEINNNSGFVFDQFNEQVDKTLTEAKGEIEAFVQNKMHSIAVDAIAAKGGIESPISIDILND